MTQQYILVGQSLTTGGGRFFASGDAAQIQAWLNCYADPHPPFIYHVYERGDERPVVQSPQRGVIFYTHKTHKEE